MDPYLYFFHMHPFPIYTSSGCAWLLQDLYSDDRRVWNALFEMVSLDFAAAERDGIASHQGKFWPIILANKGDWSYLATPLNYSKLCACLYILRSHFLKHFGDWLLIFFHAKSCIMRMQTNIVRAKHACHVWGIKRKPWEVLQTCS